MREYSYRHIVTLDETNLVGNVYFAHYVHWQGHCRERFLAEHAPGVLKALQTGDLAMVTLSCRMDYYAECFALDEVEVAMTLSECGGHRVGMSFEFRRDARLVARGDQTVACLSRTPDGMAPTELPVELAAALAGFAASGSAAGGGRQL
jgi:enediyne biosynthesis thioesterase